VKVLVIHGPNLDLLGSREPEVYGDLTLAQIDAAIQERAGALGIEVEIHQSAREGEIVELLGGASGRIDAAIVNPAAYTHTSRAIADAIRAVDYPVIEVHLSNIHAREEWRRVSVTAEAAAGVVTGFGVGSYLAALHAIEEMLPATEGKS
jgi:3-dehydroquinate dehydratase-2